MINSGIDKGTKRVQKIISTHPSNSVRWVKVEAGVNKIMQSWVIRKRVQRTVPSVLIRDVHKYARRTANRGANEYTAGSLHA
jgi:hypothetical protein